MNVPPEEGKGPAKSVGVGGWLLVLIAVLLVIGPAFSIVGVVKLLSSAANSPADTGTVHFYKQLTAITLVAFAGASVYAAIGLIVRRSPSAVTTAIWILWLTGPVGLFLVSCIYPVLLTGALHTFGLVIPSALPDIGKAGLGAALWTAYLARSKRVKNTYGRAAGQAT